MAACTLLSLMLLQVALRLWPMLVLLGFTVGLVTCLVAAVVLVLVAWESAVPGTRRWLSNGGLERVCGSAVGLTVFLSLQAVPSPRLSLAVRLGDAVEVCLHRGELSREVAARQAAGFPRPVVLVETGGFMPGASGVGLDASGRVEREPDTGLQSPWDDGSPWSPATYGPIVVRRVFGDYFVWFTP